MNDSIAEIPLLPVKTIKEPKSSADLKIIPVSVHKAVELLEFWTGNRIKIKRLLKRKICKAYAANFDGRWYAAAIWVSLKGKNRIGMLHYKIPDRFRGVFLVGIDVLLSSELPGLRRILE